MGMIINPYCYASGGAVTDPYFSNVVALLHGDGTNGSTTITDNSTSAKTWTASSGAAISTAHASAFNGAAILFDGVDDYISSASHADWGFGTGDFCVEGRFSWTSHTATATMVSNYTGSTAGFVFQWRPDLGNVLRVGYGDTALLDSSSWIPTNGVMYHLRAARSGGTLRIFANGTIVGSTANSTNMSSTAAMYVGRLGNLAAQHFPGYAEEIRITKGAGRDTSAFTAQSTAWPNA